ncbi:MAG: hypothetical protein C5B52_05290 [Bacteroidetes bacterium]|nr:MAG: hypothetical protein C5B52_05290 [Bacteroidota bacterium]
MDNFYLSIGLLTAGVALLAGIICLISGLDRDGDKTDFVFGILCLSAFVFLILPRAGFVLNDNPPYSSALEFKRVFIWSYYLLLIWFIRSYSGYSHKGLIYAAACLMVASYFIMLFTKQDRALWYYMSRVGLGLITWYGIVGASRQIIGGKKSEGKWLMTAMIIFGVLIAISTVNSLGQNFMSKALGMTYFFPNHLNVLAFIVIMSMRLRSNTHERYRLEKQMRWKDTRWNTLVESMQLLVIELDKQGKINGMNPYALQKLGNQTIEEVLHKDWFSHFTSKEEASLLRELFLNSISENKLLTHFNPNVISRNGLNLIISWTDVFIYNPDETIKGVVRIGMDTTEQVRAFEQVRKLKNELEKENLHLKGQPAFAITSNDIIGESEAIQYAIQKSLQVSGTDAGVLLLGETGAGKELFADLIYKNSDRKNKEFIRVNCAALPAELIESELFGHEKGSFTGAIAMRKGKFELAHGGTIFLDEIGELPLALQAKLLRVLQSGEFERIGGQNLIKVDVRVIAATNRNIQQEVKLGKFREDLYYRLNIFPITIPPLRKRAEDIPLLISHYVRKFAARHHKIITEVSKGDLIKLSEYSWPGNIRELVNLVESSVICSEGNTLRIQWQNNEEKSVSSEPSDYILMEDVERAHILKILTDCNWKINGNEGAAMKLGMHPSTLRSRLKKLQIEREHEKTNFQ